MTAGARIGLLLMLATFSHGLLATETVNYTASYKGVFSLFESIGIADVTLTLSDIEGADETAPVRKISLFVSSEHFSTVERLYPFRYLFNSYVTPQNGKTFAFEHIKTGKKNKQYVGLIGVEKETVQLFEKEPGKAILSSGETYSLLNSPDIKAFTRKYGLRPKSQPLTGVQEPPVDRLTLLENIRQQIRDRIPLKSYAVTNGSDLLRYRVSMVDESGSSRNSPVEGALKVKIEAFRAGEPEFRQSDPAVPGIVESSRQPNYLHAPVYAWFGDDQKALPLRFVNRHAIGEFQIEITENQAATQQLAALSESAD